MLTLGSDPFLPSWPVSPSDPLLPEPERWLTLGGIRGVRAEGTGLQMLMRSIWGAGGI